MNPAPNLGPVRPEPAPYRVCCLQRHWGPQCEDGKVMCCLCFDRFPVEELALEDGTPIDICKPCYEADMAEATRRGKA